MTITLLCILAALFMLLAGSIILRKRVQERERLARRSRDLNEQARVEHEARMREKFKHLRQKVTARTLLFQLTGLDADARKIPYPDADVPLYRHRGHIHAAKRRGV